MYNYVLVDLLWGVDGIVNAALHNPEARIYVAQSIVKRLMGKWRISSHPKIEVLMEFNGDDVLLTFDVLEHLKDVNCHCYPLIAVDIITDTDTESKYVTPKNSNKIIVIARND